MSIRLLLLLTLCASLPALADSLVVDNPSFEILPSPAGLPFGCGTGCAYSVGAIPGWNGGSVGGQFQPGAPGNQAYFKTLSLGPTSAFSEGGTFSQVVGSATVATGVTYTLLVDLGYRVETPYTFAASAGLLINSIFYPAIGTEPTRGGWATFTATYTGLSADAGQQIVIELRSSGAQANFDNVRLSDSLSAPSAVPEPGFLALGGLMALAAMKSRARRTS